jgi:hypothetical protein
MPPSVRTIITVAAVLGFAFQLMAESPKVLRIAVSADGRVTADGRVLSIDALGPILRDLAKSKGEVWYYREAAQSEPHPNALRVLSLIVDNSLPVSLSTKPDYSDVVDDKGRSVPRTRFEKRWLTSQPGHEVIDPQITQRTQIKENFLMDY